jgi:amino acid transporter
MKTRPKSDEKSGMLISLLVFVIIVVVLLIIALLNAPTMGGPKVMENMQTYLAEVKVTAIPFMIAVGVIAIALAALVAREVHKTWPNKRRFNEFITGYSFLAPYLIVTLTFMVGVILFALYISFTDYDIFTRPTWVGLANYAKAFEGFTDAPKRNF